MSCHILLRVTMTHFLILVAIFVYNPLSISLGNTDLWYMTSFASKEPFTSKVYYLKVSHGCIVEYFIQLHFVLSIALHFLGDWPVLVFLTFLKFVEAFVMCFLKTRKINR